MSAVQLGAEVEFYGDPHTPGDRRRPRMGKVTGIERPDGSREQSPQRSSITGYSGGYCFDHREVRAGKTRPTLTYYMVISGTHQYGVCECQLIVGQLTLF